MMLRDGHCFRDLSLDTCARARITPNIAFESGQFSSLLGMVAAGIGVSLVPEMAIDRNVGCRYVRLSDIQATRTIVAAVCMDAVSTACSKRSYPGLEESHARPPAENRLLRVARPGVNPQRTAPAGTASGVSQLWRSGFLPSARAKNSSWMRLVMGPREPMPILTRSMERMG